MLIKQKPITINQEGLQKMNESIAITFQGWRKTKDDYQEFRKALKFNKQQIESLRDKRIAAFDNR